MKAFKRGDGSAVLEFALVIAAFAFGAMIFVFFLGTLQGKALSMRLYNMHSEVVFADIYRIVASNGQDNPRPWEYEEYVSVKLRQKDQSGNTISDGHCFPDEKQCALVKLAFTKGDYDAAGCSDIPDIALAGNVYIPTAMRQEEGVVIAIEVSDVYLQCNGRPLGTGFKDPYFRESETPPDPKLPDPFEAIYRMALEGSCKIEMWTMAGVSNLQCDPGPGWLKGAFSNSSGAGPGNRRSDRGLYFHYVSIATVQGFRTQPADDQSVPFIIKQ